jgi:hypothetical protein
MAGSWWEKIYETTETTRIKKQINSIYCNDWLQNVEEDPEIGIEFPTYQEYGDVPEVNNLVQSPFVGRARLSSFELSILMRNEGPEYNEDSEDEHREEFPEDPDFLSVSQRAKRIYRWKRKCDNEISRETPKRRG